MDSNDPNRLVRPETYAQHIESSRAFVYKLMSEGLPSMKLGRSRRIRVADADAWLAQRADSEVAS